MRDRDQRCRLVGRSFELGVLETRLSQLATGQGSFVAIVSDAGMGKTRLVHRAADLARELGIHALTARGVELGGIAPYDTVAAALEPLLTATPDWWFRRLGDERVALLRGVLPTLDGDASPGPKLEAERWRYHRAIRDLLALLSSDDPLLLALDDLHEADTATIELVGHLLRREPLPGVTMVIAYRPLQSPELLRRAVEVAALEGVLQRLELGPLTEREAGELLGAAFDRATGRALYQQSGGNPLFLEQLARAWRRGPAAAVHDAPELPLPESIRTELIAGLDSLDPAIRRFLNAGAVIGEEFDVDVAGAVAGMSEPDALAAYDVMAELEIVRSGPAARIVAFHHPLVRRAVYDLIPYGERRNLHRRAARALEGRASRWAVAHHVALSATRGDDRAIDLLLQAGHAAALQAPADAACWFTSARRLLGENAPAERRMSVLVPLARALATTGRLSESRDMLAQALPLADGPLAHMRLAIVTVVGQLGVLAGLRADGRRLLQEERARAGDEATREVCALRLALATNHLILEEVDPATDAAEEALALARRLEDAPLVFAATGLLAFGRYQHGAVVAAHRLCADAVASVDALPDADLVLHLDMVSLLGHTLYALERFHDASRILQRGLGIAREAGAAAWFEPLLITLAQTRQWQGQLLQAAELAEEALEASTVTGNEHARLWALTVHGWIAMDRGDLGTALDASQQAAALAERTPLAMFRWTADVVRGAALLEAERPAAAREALFTAGGSTLAAIPSSFRARWFGVLARCDIALGHVDAAESWVEAAERSAAPLDLVGRTADTRHARAALLLGKGDPAAAAVLAEQASQLHLSAHLVVDAARDHLLAGEALAAAMDGDAAALQLRSAHALASDTGAMGLRERAEKLLTQLGMRPITGSVPVPAAGVTPDLTPREREIAVLVADGLSNREIGSALNLSARTIERHVTKLRRNLGVPSRAAVASTVARNRERFAHE